ncbi:ribulose-phosphate 3-epimerase [bacterium]|nr:ribulose-phosphate 3-epimerase [bacterium]
MSQVTHTETDARADGARGEDGGRVLIAPSILSADFLDLRADVRKVARDADYVHVDVMDGHFTPNLTIGPKFVSALKASFETPLDVHLMVTNPEESIDWYLDAGADVVTMHLEALTHANRAIQRVHARGALAGIAVNPATPTCLLRDVVEEADLILIMSVNPGFGGQKFIPAAVRRVREVRELADELGAHPLIEVDGGIKTATIGEVARAGARMFVAGSAVFGAQDPAAAVRGLREAADAALA